MTVIWSAMCTDLLESSNMLFQLNWPGNLPIQGTPNVESNSIIMRTADDERYECILPEDRSSHHDNVINYPGPSPKALLEGIFKKKICTVRIETYWSYELCHGRHIRQYHEEKLSGKEIKLQEYSLGTELSYPEGDRYKIQEMDTIVAAEGETIDDLKAPTTIIDGKEVPYFELIMSDGALCDLKSGEPRKTHVLYICEETGRNEIYSLKETSSCEYEAIILTPVLCAHPLYKVKDAPINNINCFALDGAPSKPISYQKLQAEPKRSQYTSSSNKPRESRPPKTPTKSQSSTPTKDKPTPVHGRPAQPSLDSDEMIRDFLAGTYCLHGGQGWWKYEFCYGKFAQQYHEDKNGKQVVVLGTWNEAEHVNWWKKNAKTKGSRSVTHFYAHGDTCDLTGRPREVQVRLKCSDNMQPNSVSIYLIEPNVCEYVLGVESPIICQLLGTADENGLLHPLT